MPGVLEASCNAGSSPRVRGKPTICIAFAGIIGLIPACAGKTGVCVFGCVWFRAHPRVCGENLRNYR